LFAALKLVSSTEKKMENSNKTTIPKIRRVFMLSLLTVDEQKVKAERKHYSPVSFTKAKHHSLVDPDDQKSNCEGKDKNVNEFHVFAKIAIIWFFGLEISLAADPG